MADVVNELHPQNIVNGGDVEAADYVRQLDDVQLVAFAAAIDRRVQALLAQGVPLPMQQIENHHLIGLLEQLVGRAKAMRVKEWHLAWVDRQLDAVESAMRARLLASGLLGDDDTPGFP